MPPVHRERGRGSCRAPAGLSPLVQVHQPDCKAGSALTAFCLLEKAQQTCVPSDGFPSLSHHGGEPQRTIFTLTEPQSVRGQATKPSSTRALWGGGCHGPDSTGTALLPPTLSWGPAGTEGAKEDLLAMHCFSRSQE